jgi:hypothetical protein
MQLVAKSGALQQQWINLNTRHPTYKGSSFGNYFFASGESVKYVSGAGILSWVAGTYLVSLSP